jgi:hypothetical protein
MRGTALIAAIATLAACSEVELVRPPVVEVLRQNPPTRVDILLVVDSSCSMQDEQERLAAGFAAFVDFFDIADIDYHIGVTTADYEVRHGRLVDTGGATFIDRSTPNPAAVFAANVQVGTDGSGAERSFDAALAALTPPIVDSSNAGFRRDDALLSLLFISDEEEASAAPVAFYIEAFRDLDTSGRRDGVVLAALVGIDPETGLPDFCGDGAGAGAAPGWRYWDAALQTGGIARSICHDEFDGLVREMGLASSRLKNRFALSRLPDPDSLEITLFIPDTPQYDLDGIPLPRAGIDGWYAWTAGEAIADDGRLEAYIEFTDLATLPPVDSHLVVRYEVAR